MHRDTHAYTQTLEHTHRLLTPDLYRKQSGDQLTRSCCQSRRLSPSPLPASPPSLTSPLSLGQYSLNSRCLVYVRDERAWSDETEGKEWTTEWGAILFIVVVHEIMLRQNGGREEMQQRSKSARATLMAAWVGERDQGMTLRRSRFAYQTEQIAHTHKHTRAYCLRLRALSS